MESLRNRIASLKHNEVLTINLKENKLTTVRAYASELRIINGCRYTTHVDGSTIEVRRAAL